MLETDATHDPARRSFVETANLARADFPLQNLPFGIFEPPGDNTGRGGVAIGDKILDIAAALEAGLVSGPAEKAASAAKGPSLNALMALGNRVAPACARGCATSSTPKARARQGRSARSRPHKPGVDGDAGRDRQFHRFSHLELPPRDPSFKGSGGCKFQEHAHRRHSRASSVRVSGGTITRPHGQWLGAENVVRFGPRRALDYELEVGAFIGLGNELGGPIALEDARSHMFGVCLLNDWSARDIQRWEYQAAWSLSGEKLRYHHFAVDRSLSTALRTFPRSPLSPARRIPIRSLTLTASAIAPRVEST